MVVPFGLLAIGIMLAYSGIKGKSLVETLRGVAHNPSGDQPYNADVRAAYGTASGVGTGSNPPAASTSTATPSAHSKLSGHGVTGNTGGTGSAMVSPFPRGAPLSWGRSDQGVDGSTRPGTPMLAIDSGTIQIHHDPTGFGASYPVLVTQHGSYYYGHVVPDVSNGARVTKGQPIGHAHPGTWGNSTTPGGFEIGKWPPGAFGAGAAIRGWLQGLQRIALQYSGGQRMPRGR